MEKPFRIIIEGSYKSTKSAVAKKVIEKLMLTAQENLDHVGKGCAFTTLAVVNQEDPRDVILSKWGVEDILDRAKQRGIKLTLTEAREILSNIDRKMDANVGINWDVIDAHTDMRNDD